MNSHRRTGLVAMLGFSILVCALTVGCSDDDDGGNKPVPITLADFEGTWEASSYKLTNPAVPLTIDLVQNGGSFDFTAADDGTFTGSAVIPGAMVGAPNDLELNYAGYVELVTQDTVKVVFDPEIPPFITTFTGAFTLSGDTFTITDESQMFDFDGPGPEGEVPAIFEGTMVKS